MHICVSKIHTPSGLLKHVSNFKSEFVIGKSAKAGTDTEGSYATEEMELSLPQPGIDIGISQSVVSTIQCRLKFEQLPGKVAPYAWQL